MRMSNRIFWGVSAVLLSLMPKTVLLAQGTRTGDSKSTCLIPAAEGVFNAFQHFPLVGIEDWHGLAQEEDFYVQLLKDLVFPKRSAMWWWSSAGGHNRRSSTGTWPERMFPMTSCARCGQIHSAGCLPSRCWVFECLRRNPSSEQKPTACRANSRMAWGTPDQLVENQELRRSASVHSTRPSPRRVDQIGDTRQT